MKIYCNKINTGIRMLVINIFLIVAAFALPASSTSINIGNFDIVSGSSVNGTLILNDVNNFGGGDIIISYDPSVVMISNIKPTNPLIFLNQNINNSTGLTTINAEGPFTGLTGDIIIADITFKAVGTAGSSSAINITVNLIDASFFDIPTTPINGTINVTAQILKYILISSSTTTTLTVGQTHNFNLTAFNQNDNPMAGVDIFWTVSNLNVGSVIPIKSTTDANGNASTMFIASNPGNTMVNATNDSFTGTALVTVGNVSPIVQNVILNPGFESETTSWIFFTNGTGTFNSTSPGYEGTKAARIDLRSRGTNVQLYQKDILLEPNTRYRLSFAAYSVDGHDLTVNLIKHGSPYTNYGLAYMANLSSDWQTFTTEFTTKSFTDTVNDGRLMFWIAPFAASRDEYYIDNVRLEIVPVAPIITIQPSDRIIYVGQTATLTAVAAGSAPLTYQWQKNGVDIPGAINISYTTLPTELSDGNSTFSVIVTNPLGSANSNDATLIVWPGVPDNLIENSGFEPDTMPWLFYTNGTGTFTSTSPGYEGTKVAKIALSSSGTNVQLYQKDILLEPNTRYRLSFAAYSTDGHDLTVNLIKHVSPYTRYGLVYTASLGTDWQTFTTEFTTKGFTDTVNDGRLMFWLAPFAKAGDRYYIDNVHMEKVN